MLLGYFLSDFEKVRVAYIITGINFAFTFYMLWISSITGLYILKSSQLVSTDFGTLSY